MFPNKDQITDARFSRLNSLYFYLSSYCNLKCSHCWIAPSYTDNKEAPEEAPFSLFEELIDQAMLLGLSHIKITGGEPFLSKNIFPLISYASKKKLAINIETNGTLITDGTAKFLKEKAVKHIAISLDGPNPGVHERLRGQRGCFDKTVAGIRALKGHGLIVQVIMSLYNANVDYLEETIDFAENLGVNSFKINCISDISRGEFLKAKSLTLNILDYIALNKKIDTVVQSRHKIKIILDIPPAFKSLKQLREDHTCGVRNIAGVLASGQISICGIGAVLSSLILGDIRERSLAEIWKNSKVFKTLREDLPHKLRGICARCILKSHCLGKCRAEAYYKTGNLFSGFSFCEQAFQLGLFPKERMYLPKKEITL